MCACARVQDRFISTYISVGGESLHPLALALSFFVVFPLAKSCPFSSSEGCGRCDQPALDCALFWIECRRCWVIVFEFSSGSLLVVVSSPCCCAVPPFSIRFTFCFRFLLACVYINPDGSRPGELHSSLTILPRVQHVTNSLDRATVGQTSYSCFFL